VATSSVANRIERRDLRRAKRRDALLDAAMSIVEEDGVDGLTVARLAQRANAAVGGLYRYFDGKQAVVAGLQHRAAARFGAFQRDRLAACAARAAGAPDTVSSLACVWVAFSAWSEFADAEPVLYRLVDNALSSPVPVLDDALAIDVEGTVTTVLDQASAQIDASVAAGALVAGDSPLRSLMLWASVHGIGHFRKRDRFMPEARHASRMQAALFTACLVGWGASPEAVSACRTFT
jgi:AcrR family transcriptional regulator